MYYHAKLEYGIANHYWWNHSKQGLIKQLVIPFVNGHICEITLRGGKKILNMKNVTLLTIYKTEQSLDDSDEGKLVNEIESSSFIKNECTSEILNDIKFSASSRGSTSLLQKALMVPKKQVFVVMKFKNKLLDSAYEGVFKPVVNEFGLDCIRIDEIQDSGIITDQILETIAESKYIIADLSGERPNCYYECGFAHALGKELIFCIQSSDEIHFDLAGYRFIQWSTEAELRRQLRDRLTKLESKTSSND